jgi:hypothetical protein
VQNAMQFAERVTWFRRWNTPANKPIPHHSFYKNTPSHKLTGNSVSSFKSFLKPKLV